MVYLIKKSIDLVPKLNESFFTVALAFHIKLIWTEVIVVCFIVINFCWTKIFVQEKKSSDAIYFSDASNVCVKKTQRRFFLFRNWDTSESISKIWALKQPWSVLMQSGFQCSICTFLLKKHGSISNFVSFKSSTLRTISIKLSKGCLSPLICFNRVLEYTNHFEVT